MKRICDYRQIKRPCQSAQKKAGDNTTIGRKCAIVSFAEYLVSEKGQEIRKLDQQDP